MKVKDRRYFFHATFFREWFSANQKSPNCLTTDIEIYDERDGTFFLSPLFHRRNAMRAWAPHFHRQGHWGCTSLQWSRSFMIDLGRLVKSTKGAPNSFNIKSAAPWCRASSRRFHKISTQKLFFGETDRQKSCV